MGLIVIKVGVLRADGHPERYLKGSELQRLFKFKFQHNDFIESIPYLRNYFNKLNNLNMAEIALNSGTSFQDLGSDSLQRNNFKANQIDFANKSRRRTKVPNLNDKALIQRKTVRK